MKKKAKKVFIIPDHLSDENLDHYKTYLIKNHFEPTDHIDEADLVLTKTKDCLILEKWLENHLDKQLISLEWLDHSMEVKKLASMRDYELDVEQLPFTFQIPFKYEMEESPKKSKNSKMKKSKAKTESEEHFESSEESEKEVVKPTKKKSTKNQAKRTDEDSTEEKEEKKSPKERKKRVYNYYECQYATRLDTPNEPLCQQLSFISKVYTATGDPWRQLAYQKAVAVLRTMKDKKLSKHHLDLLPNIGPSLHFHLSEYLETGKISLYEQFRNDQDIKSLLEFQRIFGIGPKRSREWVDQGYKEWHDLPKDHPKVQIWFKYFKQSDEPFSYKEAKEMTESLAKIMDQEYKENLQYEFVGSFKRQKPNISDLDLVLTYHDQSQPMNLFSLDLMAFLEQEGIVKEVLQGASARRLESNSHDSEFVYHTICQLNGHFIQVDFVFSHPENYYFSILGWTGSTLFERAIRRYSEEQYQLKLTNQGLWDKDEKLVLRPKSEKEIFEYLNLNYLPPEERNC